MRLVVGVTGATGAIIGVRLLEALRTLDVETHLVLSQWARATIEMETDYSVREVQKSVRLPRGPTAPRTRLPPSPADRSAPTA